jgi:hypothetical protein
LPPSTPLRKMSDEGKSLAVTIDMSSAERALLEQALAE